MTTPNINRRPTRREFIGSTLAAGSALLTGCASTASKSERSTRTERAKPRNIIVIIADTWRADYLGAYGNEWIQTPNLDRFAAESVVFKQCYADGLPTIPARRVYFTGRTVLPESLWRPLLEDDVSFPQVLKKKGYTTGFVVDTYHYFKPNMNFHEGFDSWQWIRGQENDKWKSAPKEEFNWRNHFPEHLLCPTFEDRMRQFFMNTRGRRSEEDYFCAQSCRAASRWLKENRSNKPFMLWIDMFDPHEPWDAPKRFQQLYREKYPFERYLFGYGAQHKDIRPEDIPVLKDLYSAEVSFSDHCIGKILDDIRKLGLMEDTVILFSTDHGTHLGEEGCVQKTAGLLNSCVAQLPLIIRHPDPAWSGKQVEALVSALDYMPTLLSLVGIEDHTGMHGTNVWPLVTGEKSAVREQLFTVFQKFGAVHDQEWHYFQHIRGNDRGKGPCLYNHQKDPSEKVNLLAQHPDIVAKMRMQLEDCLGMKIPEVS
ncbi:MAG: sulfatase [bacterium]